MPKKRKKNIITFILVFVVLLLISGSAYAYSLNNSYKNALKQGETLMSQGKYEEAKEVFSTLKNGKYFSKNITLLDSYISDAALLINSSNTFKEGEDLFGSKKYLEAIEKYKNVNEKDINFEESQNKITLCTNQYVDAKLNESKELASKKNYNDALIILNDLLKTYPDNQSALELKNQFTSELEEQNKPQYTSNSTQQTQNNTGGSLRGPQLTDQLINQKKALDKKFEEEARKRLTN